MLSLRQNRNPTRGGIVLIPDEYIEITTAIGCPVACLKYCPQEIIRARYCSDHIVMSLQDFKRYTSSIPTSIPVAFSGYCEPFTSRDCTDMILYSYECGRAVDLYTTLVGLSITDADRIAGIPFRRFVLHLPDSKAAARIPITPKYLKVLTIILQNVENIRFMNLGGCLVNNGGAELARMTASIRSGRLGCDKHYYPNLQILPDGRVFACCMDRGMEHFVGDLTKEDYPVLRERFLSTLAYDMQVCPGSICHRCKIAEPYMIRKVILEYFKLKEWLL